MLVARKDGRIDWLRDLGSFALMVAIAAWQRWEARDLIWGLWISSLVIGYSFILVTALSSYTTDTIPEMPRRRKNRAEANGGKKEAAASAAVQKFQPLAMNLFVVIASFMFLGPRSEVAWTLLILNAGFAVIAVMLARGVRGRRETVLHTAARRFFLLTPSVMFFLGFFTVHFGGFHFVHGLFLNGFFPIAPGSPFGESIGGTFEFFAAILGAAVRRGWVFILFSAWARLPDLRRAFESAEGPNMFLPYGNVVRMHLLIFVFAGLNAAGLAGWALYPVLFFYFFPMGKLLKRISLAVPKPRVMAGKGLAEGEVVVGAAPLGDAEGEGYRSDEGVDPQEDASRRYPAVRFDL